MCIFILSLYKFNTTHTHTRSSAVAKARSNGKTRAKLNHSLNERFSLINSAERYKQVSKRTRGIEWYTEGEAPTGWSLSECPIDSGAGAHALALARHNESKKNRQFSIKDCQNAHHLTSYCADCLQYRSRFFWFIDERCAWIQRKIYCSFSNGIISIWLFVWKLESFLLFLFWNMVSVQLFFFSLNAANYRLHTIFVFANKIRKA